MNHPYATLNHELNAHIASIVRQVIARLNHDSAHLSAVNISSANFNTTQTSNTATSISDVIITAATIEQLSGKPSQVFVHTKAIVTPAARDAAKERGIAISRSVALPPEQVPSTNQLSTNQSSHPKPGKSNDQITDSQNPERAAAVTQQLSRRGIESINTSIVLSDTPAVDVDRFCRQSQPAVMIGLIADVDRFRDELDPEVWVLDMKRLNLIAAVNVVAQINKNRT